MWARYLGVLIAMSMNVVISQKLLDVILGNARAAYPREMILLLRGKAKIGRIEVTDLVIPPLATQGEGFSSFPTNMLPMDFSLIGSVHSHPSGIARPSTVDWNRFFGRILMIVAYPFIERENVAVYSYSGEKITLQVTE